MKKGPPRPPPQKLLSFYKRCRRLHSIRTGGTTYPYKHIVICTDFLSYDEFQPEPKNLTVSQKILSRIGSELAVTSYERRLGSPLYISLKSPISLS